MMTSSLGPMMALVAFMKRIGSSGIGSAGLGGVVGVVEADADELADLADAGADARVAVETRQVFRIDGADALEPLSASALRPRCRGRCGGGGCAVLGKEGGFLGALGAHTHQLHRILPIERATR